MPSPSRFTNTTRKLEDDLPSGDQSRNERPHLDHPLPLIPGPEPASPVTKNAVSTGKSPGGEHHRRGIG